MTRFDIGARITAREAGRVLGSTRNQRRRVMAGKHEVAKAGISFGTALAITISWSLHKSLLWAGIHGIFGWFYVVYYALTR